MSQHGLHEAPRRELLPGVTRRAAVLVVGVLLLQLGFVLSYVGAFHSPTPRDVPLAVVAPAGAPAGTADSLVAQLDGLPGGPVDATAYDTEDAARQALGDRDVDGVLLVGSGTEDALLVAGAEGGAVTSALEQVLTQVEGAQQRTLTTTDTIPAGDGDARGLSAFYLAVGWVVGGYLVASIIGISAGSRPLTRGRGATRLGALGVYSLVSGLGGAIVAGPVLGALDGGHPLALTAFGALLVFAVGAFTMALQVWTGLVGIGLAIVLFVILGNPSAGGAYPAPLLPPFWSAIGPWLPPGAGTGAVRGIVYFSGAGVAQACWVLAAYAVVGVLATLVGSGRVTAAEPEPVETVDVRV
ncbi:ABC-2 family transporter protein [Klenkia marina]|uniref:ABC-2 family transporter protein n=1 Tax=Klenkia marina TaxID=1960309 RepID=A0A1G4XX95_9ACTN|nr:ABC transporter permease [Klenkia marina]SCX45804.1 ABC-2 family transporter protein [Klenkia marina]